MSLKDEILTKEDPVKELTQVVMDLCFEDADFLRSTHKLVCREMGLHPDTMIGGDVGDGYEHFIAEEDPRYDLYWAHLTNLHHTIFAQAISQDKFRYTLAHRRSLVAAKIRQQARQYLEVPQTADINDYLRQKGER